MDGSAFSGPGDGRVVKRAVNSAQAARIAAEAEVLAAGQIPGVVELVGLDDDGERPGLVTTRVEGPDLGRVHDLSLHEVGGVVAAVATILADLHDLGLVHGALMASHVLVGPDGRPVLCGLGYGGRIGDPPVAEAPLPEGHRDPARRAGDPLAGSSDVYALGALLRALATTASVTASDASVPARSMARAGRLLTDSARSGRRRLRPTDRPTRDGLLVVADRATTSDPRLRLGARSLAAAVGLAVPGARLPRRTEPERAVASVRPEPSALAARRPGGPLSSGVTSPKAMVLGAGLAAAVVAVVALRLMTAGAAAPVSASSGAPAVVSTTPDAARPEATATALSSLPSSAPSSAPTTTPTPTRLNPACPAVAAALAADTDGDGCPEALRWTDGVLEGGDRRWVVGQPGDRVATADWSCSGRSTLALLRPATGEVFVFSAWAGTGHDLVAEVAGRVGGGFAIRAADSGDGCPRIAVERREGAPVTLAKPRFSAP